MLIVNNGVPKSGSTWIQRIVRALADPAFPDPEWCSDATNPSVLREKLQAYVESGEWLAGYTLIKQHLPYSRDLEFLTLPGIRVLVTYRDLPDSVVSYFHHQERLGKAEAATFDAWLQRGGRRYAVRAIRHRESWRGVENALLLRYEDMLGDARAAVLEIMEFLDLPPDEALAASVATKTQARPAPDGLLNEGKHIRTAGRRVAQDELPASFHQELVDLQAATELGSFDEQRLEDFLQTGRPGKKKLRLSAAR